MECKLCKCDFEKTPKQKEARWAATWCDMGKGYLCPDCNKAAKELGALDEWRSLGILPWGQ